MIIFKNTIFYTIIFLYCSYISCQEIDLYLYEKRLISQNGEDGIIEKIFNIIGATSKYYVEFGAGDGHFCSNTKYLREKYKWSGLLLEGSGVDIPEINLHKEFITAENICDLFAKYNVPSEFDLISIDIDRNDFYVWKALSAHYQPRVVIIESNFCLNYDEDKVVKYDPYGSGCDDYSGASVLALYKLGRHLGYSLVYQESNGVNLFFIKDDILKNTSVTFKNINNVQKLYCGHPKYLNPRKCHFISSVQAIKQGPNS